MKIAVISVGTRGDVEPHMALCSGLIRRGHQVKLAASIDFERQAADRGLNFHPINVSIRGLYDTNEGAGLQTTDHRSLEFIRNLRNVASSIAEPVVSGIRGACQGADAICYSPLGMPAYYIAREMGIPSAATCLQPIGRTNSIPSPVVFPSLPVPRSLNRMTHVLAEQIFWQFFRPLLRASSKIGVPFFGHFNELYRSGKPMLFAYSPAVVPRPADFQANMHVTGFWTLPPETDWRPSPELAAFVAGGPPPVCIGFGSMNSERIERILEVTVQAIRETGRRAVILRGWWKQRLAPNDLGRDTFVMDAAPHSWLFPRVSMVVHHGGAGTTAAALRAGVPSIVTPFFFDQSFWAHWLHRLGLGPGPIPFNRVSRLSMRTALEAAEKSTLFKERLSALSVQLQAEDGVGRAVALLEMAWNANR